MVITDEKIIKGMGIDTEGLCVTIQGVRISCSDIKRDWVGDMKLYGCTDDMIQKEIHSAVISVCRKYFEVHKDKFMQECRENKLKRVLKCG